MYCYSAIFIPLRFPIEEGVGEPVHMNSGVSCQDTLWFHVGRNHIYQKAL